MRSRNTYAKQLPESSSSSKKETAPSLLAQLALHSLTLHLMEEGAQETTNAVEKKRYEKEADKINLKMKELQLSRPITKKSSGVKAAVQKSIKPLLDAIPSARLRSGVPQKPVVGAAKKSRKK
jgi:hypothetical protein